MTEAEWLTCTDPFPMLRFLEGKTSGRKLRLSACACCRHYWHLFREEASRKAVLVAERFADGLATPEELEEAQEESIWAAKDGDGFDPSCCCYYRKGQPYDPEAAASALVATLETLDNRKVVADLSGLPRKQWKHRHAGLTKEQWEEEYRALADLLRDILGNPFRPVNLDPAWVKSDVLDLARSIYDERAFGRMPTLADALEGSGCDNADVLNHCRIPSEHAKGCWVIDAISGKS